jgi:hypothetical protein
VSERGQCVRNCLEHDPLELMRRYLDGKPMLTNDDREVLLFALYMESKNNNGLAKEALDSLKQAHAKEGGSRDGLKHPQ